MAGGWRRALDAQTREIESEVPYHLDDQAAVDMLWGRACAGEDEIYIGYPIEQFVDRNGTAR